MTAVTCFLAEYGLQVAGGELAVLLLLMLVTRIRSALRPRLLSRRTIRLINQDSDVHPYPPVPSEKAGVERGSAPYAAAAPPAAFNPVDAAASRTSPRPPASTSTGAGRIPPTPLRPPGRELGGCDMATRALTDRETLLSHGMTNRETGEFLDISEDAAKAHTLRIYEALCANNRAHAVRLGLQEDLLQPRKEQLSTVLRALDGAASEEPR